MILRSGALLPLPLIGLQRVNNALPIPQHLQQLEAARLDALAVATRKRIHQSALALFEHLDELVASKLVALILFLARNEWLRVARGVLPSPER